MNTVISYPYFYPTRHWLKVAALCWDKVYTLRDPFVCREPDDISELDHALGGILDSIDIKTISGDSQIKEEFEAWIASHLRQLRSPQAIARSRFILLDGMFESNLDYDAFKNTLRRFGIYSEGTLSEKQLPRWEFEPRLTYAEAVYVPEDPNNLRRDYYYRALIAGNKRKARKFLKTHLKDNQGPILNRVRGRLEDFISNQQEKVEQVVFLPQEIPFHYIALCASKAAAVWNSDLASNSKVYMDTCLYNSRKLAGEVSTCLLQGYLPSHADELDLAQIAELREELATRRLQYQKDVQSLCDEFAKVASEGQLHNMKERIIDLGRERVEETKKVYKRARLETILKTFSMSVAPPVLVSSLASSLGIGIFAPAGIAAALAILVGTKLIEFDKAKAERNRSSWSYLLDLHEFGRHWWQVW